eukprot:767407-Hanusia_phi.AAC.4
MRIIQDHRRRLLEGNCLHDVLEAQLSQCVAKRCKNQKRALLMYLHIATVQGVLEPPVFEEPGCPDTFFGWTGFQVCIARREEFAKGLAGLFGDEATGRRPATNTLHNMFRRAQLIPEIEGGWKEAFEGKVRFIFEG